MILWLGSAIRKIIACTDCLACFGVIWFGSIWYGSAWIGLACLWIVILINGCHWNSANLIKSLPETLRSLYLVFSQFVALLNEFLKPKKYDRRSYAHVRGVASFRFKMICTTINWNIVFFNSFSSCVVYVDCAGAKYTFCTHSEKR